jgi:hypothetical protein
MRKLGGYYLEGNPGGVDCGRLPVRLIGCESCGQRPKFTRTLQKIDPRAILHAAPKTCAYEPSGVCVGCPFGGNLEARREPVGLMWVGARHYTPAEFSNEAALLGVSKRINKPQEWLRPGETWIYLAHQDAVPLRCENWLTVHGDPCQDAMGYACKMCDGQGWQREPGVFMAFRLKRVVKIVSHETPHEEVQALLERNIEPVYVDPRAPEHQADWRDDDAGELPLEVGA